MARYSNSVQVRDGRDEYVPTPKERRANAMRLARDAARAATREAWMRQRAEGATALTLREALYRDALAGLAELIATADDDRDRLKAMELVLSHQLECQRLTLEYAAARVPMTQTSQPIAADPTPSASASNNVLSREEAIEVLQQRRKLVAVGV